MHEMIEHDPANGLLSYEILPIGARRGRKPAPIKEGAENELEIPRRRTPRTGMLLEPNA